MDTLLFRRSFIRRPSNQYPDPVIDYKHKCLTLECITEDAVIKINPLNKDINYCLNNNSAVKVTSLTSILLYRGDTLTLYGNNNTLCTASGSTNPSDSNCVNIYCTNTNDRVVAYGNVLSLLFGKEYIETGQMYGLNAEKYLTSTNAKGLAYLFFNNISLYDASNLILNGLNENISKITQILPEQFFRGMFYGCTNLVRPPSLNLCYKYLNNGEYIDKPCDMSPYCYGAMFKECTSLIEAPELPAINLASNCYAQMFLSCSSLTKSPILPATKGVTNCYTAMFNNCTSLNTITALKTNTIPCSASWLVNVSATGTFYKHPNATTGSGYGSKTWTRNADGIPSGWTVVNYTE